MNTKNHPSASFSPSGFPVSFASGRPPEGLTNALWQDIYAQMKAAVQPSRFKRLTGTGAKNCVFQGASPSYDGMTNWQSYCQFINDSLTQLRRGQTVYAYYDYQIKDFLRFEGERLVTRYVKDGRYWEVWLLLPCSPSAFTSLSKRRIG